MALGGSQAQNSLFSATSLFWGFRLPRFSGFFCEYIAGVSEIEHGQIQTTAGIAVLGALELGSDALDRGGGKVLDGADTELGFENNHQHAAFVHGHDEHAEFLPLLIDAVEVGFV